MSPDTSGRGSIPAWAGKTLGSYEYCPDYGVHPRVGGGDDPGILGLDPILGPSPRGRGRPTGMLTGEDDAGSIPAWAGETTIGETQQDVIRVHPRVGGGDI